MDIQLGKVSSSTELEYEFRDQWEGVLVLDCHRVECMIVLNQLERAILFLDEEHWSCHRKFGRSNSSGVQIFLQEGVQLLLFYQRQRVDFGRLRLQAQNKLDSIVLLPVFWKNVEVFFCKYEFKTFGAVGQGEKSFLCF